LVGDAGRFLPPFILTQGSREVTTVVVLKKSGGATLPAAKKALILHVTGYFLPQPQVWHISSSFRVSVTPLVLVY